MARLGAHSNLRAQGRSVCTWATYGNTNKIWSALLFQLMCSMYCIILLVFGLGCSAGWAGSYIDFSIFSYGTVPSEVNLRKLYCPQQSAV